LEAKVEISLLKIGRRIALIVIFGIKATSGTIYFHVFKQQLLSFDLSPRIGHIMVGIDFFMSECYCFGGLG
jgi:hypothetical protein